MDASSLKVLLIDDDEDDYVLTRDLLSGVPGAKYDLEWSATYEAGREEIRRKKHDVYLLDYRLGDRTGLDLLREVIADGCTAPIILLTGRGDRDIDMEAMKAGAADYMVKGQIDTSILERSIRYAVERKRAEEQILYLAYYDSLTGLPNRALFKDRLSQAITHAERYRKLVAMLFFDLDNFKQINDTLGHRIGDLLLKEIAGRLAGCVRKADSFGRQNIDDLSSTTIARLGGDEFTVLLTDITYIEDAAKVASRIINELSRPFDLDGHEVFISASIGVAAYPLDGEDTDTLIKNADSAMYHAKNQGKNNFQFYKQSMNLAALKKLTMENDLRRALERREFLLYYQPQIDCKTRAITGLEALIRWKHPEMGMVSPTEFIPLAEDTGLILPIGEWVLRTACAQFQTWQHAELSPVRISVNLSGLQFGQPDFVQTIARIVADSCANPRDIVLEITESIIMKNVERTIAMVNELSAIGLRFMIDDFGTGYSSLSYLKRFPLNALKIDRSFVQHVTTNQDDAVITKTIIDMAHNLKLKVIAECVETEDQMAFLLDHGCDEIQGYLFSRPLPAEEVTKLLAAEKEKTGIGPSIGRR